MIFDTDVMIWFFRGDYAAARLIDSMTSRAISIVSFMELVQGARGKPEVKQIQRFLQQEGFRVIPINEAISYSAASLIEEHAQKDGLQLADALIAATVRQAGEPLATGNVRHFRPIDGLDLKSFRPSQRGV